jgi:hypothetical protein
MRKLAWVVGALALLGCAGYVFVYLYRWEWNRALLMAAFFLATEIALATALVLRAVGRSSIRHHDDADLPRDAVAARLRQAAPRRDHFAWLGVKGDRTAVFITMLVGGGVLVSGLAWLVDRIAGRTAGAQMEARLAEQLDAIAFPSGGLVPDQTELLAEDAPFEDDADLRLLLGTPRP